MFHLPYPTGLTISTESGNPRQANRNRLNSAPVMATAATSTPGVTATTRTPSVVASSHAMSAEAAPSQEEVENGKQDPGLKFLRDIHLTPEEDARYASLARGWIPDLVGFEASDEGWKLSSTLFGVKVWSRPNPDDSDSSLVICRGQIPLTQDVTFEMVKTQFVDVFNTSEILAQQMRASDPMSRETKILYQIPCEEGELIRISWGSFKAAGVAWARDFCFLQHAAASTDPATGERLFCVVSGSIERPEVPDMEKLCKRIRSTVKTSGLVFREPKDGGPMRATYVVNVNPNGWIPSKIVNIICTNQAMNVSRVKNKLHETAKALAALKIGAPIFPKAIGWRQTHEFPLRRPAPGSAASTVSVKFSATSKVTFRVVGATAATADWAPAEASTGVGAGETVTYPADTPTTMTFKLRPEAAGGNGARGGGAVGASDVELEEAKSSVVLEWKGAGWFGGLVIYHLVEVA
ncbi:unnamed protein product [Ectocarpus sp. 6 AP-2014]